MHYRFHVFTFCILCLEVRLLTIFRAGIIANSAAWWRLTLSRFFSAFSC